MAKPTTFTKKLGTKIRKARKAAGLTQLELAHRIGHTGEDAGAYISRVEKGSTQPRLDVLAKLAKVFDLSVEKLLGGNV
jgi:transcriptional regulator with XRE-family HTH domain